jgi:hypothetical protein
MVNTNQNTCGGHQIGNRFQIDMFHLGCAHVEKVLNGCIGEEG